VKVKVIDGGGGIPEWTTLEVISETRREYICWFISMMGSIRVIIYKKYCEII